MKKRRLLAGTGIAILLALCGMGALGFSLLTRMFPVSFSSPQFIPGQPLGEGEALAFSYMRLDMFRPFALYTYDDTRGFLPLSEGRMGTDIQPVWSPDGTQLAYQSVSREKTRFSLMDADGGNRREIPPDDTHKGLLRWSPDGTRLAFLAYLQSPDGAISSSADLCVIEISTGVTHRAPAGNIQDLVWLPDSQSLIAVVRDDELVAIERYDADGNHERRISAADFLQEAASITLSPDAGKAAYLRWGTAEDYDTLYISTLDGSALHAVRLRWLDGTIAWSPDSTKIAFVALTDDYLYALYVLGTDGTDLQELMLINPGDESGEIRPAAPAWSPDGGRLAIPSYADPEGPAVFVLNADGSQRRQIFAAPGIGSMVYDLAWRPEP